LFAIGRKAPQTGNQTAGAGASGGIVLPRILRRPVRAVLRVAREGVSVRPVAVVGLVGGILAVVAGAGLWQGGHFDRLVAEATSRAGFRVADIRIDGASEVSRIDVLTNMDLGPERSLFSFDVHRARDDLRRLPWVQEATVHKAYPDRLVVTLTERTPFAVWQSGKALNLVDRGGKEITPFDERFAQLPLVVGAGANEHAAEIVSIVARFPAIAEQMKAYVRVADRRWDLVLATGLLVRLPDGGEDSALAELVDRAERDELLERAVDVVDLRVPGQFVVRLTQEAEEERLRRVKQRGISANPKEKQT
jgi:cell division protein FtsQ